MNILLIGIGKIGYRHFQGLYKLDKIFKIYLYDIFAESLNPIRKNFSTTDLTILKNLDDAPKSFFLCIVATASKDRLKVLLDLDSLKIKTKHLILEKVVCQSLNDLQLINNISKRISEKTLVNQWLRRWINSKNIIKKDEYIQRMIVRGRKWGIGCNALHFLDAFEYFSKNKILSNNYSCVLSKPYITKRRDFYDIFGSINLTSSCGSSLDLISYKSYSKEGDDYFIEIETNKENFSLNLTPKNIIFKNQNRNLDPKIYNLYLISEEMKIIVNELYNNEESYLPTLKSSSRQHKILFEILKNVPEWNNDSHLPIT